MLLLKRESIDIPLIFKLMAIRYIQISFEEENIASRKTNAGWEMPFHRSET